MQCARALQVVRAVDHMIQLVRVLAVYAVQSQLREVCSLFVGKRRHGGFSCQLSVVSYPIAYSAIGLYDLTYR